MMGFDTFEKRKIAFKLAILDYGSKMPSFTTKKSAIPILLHLPHNSTLLPEDFTWQLATSTLEREIYRLVDHHTDVLFQPFIDAGAAVIQNNHCRLYFDPERYADREEEEMYKMGMGAFYTHTTEGEQFRSLDSDQEYAEKLLRHYYPYHQAFENIVSDILQQFGWVLIIDGHSYPKEPLPSEQYLTDPRPEVDIGTCTTPYRHTSRELSETALQIFGQAGYSVGLDTPFKGSIVPLSFTGDTRVQTMMLEIRRDIYLCDDSDHKREVRIDHQKMQRFHLTLQQFIQAVLSHDDGMDSRFERQSQ